MMPNEIEFDAEQPFCLPPLLVELHRRRHRVAALVQTSAARLADKHPYLLEKRAHATLLSAVCEKLMTESGDLSDFAVAALSEAIAEHRKITLRDPEGAPKEEKVKVPFRDIVKQTYGVNWHGREDD